MCGFLGLHDLELNDDKGEESEDRVKGSLRLTRRGALVSALVSLLVKSAKPVVASMLYVINNVPHLSEMSLKMATPLESNMRKQLRSRRFRTRLDWQRCELEAGKDDPWDDSDGDLQVLCSGDGVRARLARSLRGTI